ncbi:metallophosphoesterase family protein [Paludisphaera mucosa]|uniref:Metallophosphoesterase n=1 Tax=Paludisphaera mucosa TaxID=3030827 RepID=A0ABT6FFL3_9BACT|nr:metallophosphoesterase [Paludisphaera mucosa]MDG3006367.1 metallophosphoesterase [Paludisphaera mucosa]
MSDSKSIVRVAAVGDLHCGKTSRGTIRPLFENADRFADVLVLCGDLTDYGLPEEAEILVEELAVASHLPIVAVLGNHDFEMGREDEVARILTDAGLFLLDGDAVEVKGVGFAGARGFAGGFGRGTLGSWGEKAVKAFVQEAVDEALKLESALARLRTESRIAVLHYAPIQATVENEPPEIFPFLGCGRLEDPLNRYPVDAVVHGHAHNGSPEGRTSGGVPVYNVSLPLMRRTSPDAPPFRIIEVPAVERTMEPR